MIEASIQAAPAPSSRTAAPVLHCAGLVKIYKQRRVVNGVDLAVHPGEIVGLLGPNGAGKTTTFYMVVGLVRPDAGTIQLGELNVTEQPMFKRAQLGIAYLPQEPSVFRKLSVRENILAVLEILPEYKDDRKKQLDRLDSLIAELNLEKVADSKAFALSGGERRRVEIARALACSPSYMLLDEPFAGIDPIVVGDLKELVRGLQQRGIGILITDHNVRETLGICDRSYILSDGKVIESGTPSEIAASPIARRFYLGEDFSL
ncbi:MAG: LPS export ABC transporter ATP-binding protein [Bdellovibrionales bacterium]|nr:LPS export ABC transporter ATP-binding protein [Bdellovibrionales bacterium]